MAVDERTRVRLHLTWSGDDVAPRPTLLVVHGLGGSARSPYMLGTTRLGSAAGFDPDDAMIAVPVALWLGWGEGLLVAAAIGAPAFALGFFVFFQRKSGS